MNLTEQEAIFELLKSMNASGKSHHLVRLDECYSQMEQLKRKGFEFKKEQSVKNRINELKEFSKNVNTLISE